MGMSIALSQVAEHGMQEVWGSNPHSSAQYSQVRVMIESSQKSLKITRPSSH